MDLTLASYQVACGSSVGTIKMHFNWHHLEASSGFNAAADDLEIAVRPLDHLCAEAGTFPEIVKIDVEGFELQVLQGAEQTLKTARLLFLEVHPERLDELGVRQSAVFDWLDSHGWSVKTHHGNRYSSAEFNDQIHTFWTICER